MDGIRSIVVHMDATARSEVRLRIARALAQDGGAQLCGLYTAAPAAYAQPLAMPEGGAPLGSPALERVERERREHARALFERVMGPAAAPPARWEEAGRLASYTALAARALTADLLVFGQHDATEPQTATEGDLVASTLVDSGTPGLVVPHSGDFCADALVRPGLTVLLAWKPTREAARAARAALPWLRQAARLHIAVASTGGDAPWPGAAQVRAWMQLHDVAAPVREHTVGQLNAGEILLSMAAEVSADLLVMGCFGHSRARELVLGGASRTVLRSMTLPTLMAH